VGRDATAWDGLSHWGLIMAISAVSATSNLPPQYSDPSSLRQEFSQLTDAINSGDLTSAQSAYSALAQSPAAQGNGPFAQALQQIGQDLQSGDIGGAQKALAALQQKVHGHHHHHHGGGAPPKDADDSNSSTSSTTSTQSTTSSSNAVDVTA